MPANAIAGHDPAQAVARACDVIVHASGQAPKRPKMTPFFDGPTNMASHVVRDPASRRYRKVVLAECPYGGELPPSFPIDPRQPRRSEFDTTHRERQFAEARVP